MSQNTMKGLPEAVGSIQYSPSPWELLLNTISRQEWPGIEDFEPFFAVEKISKQSSVRENIALS